VQIAMLTHRINELQAHFRQSPERPRQPPRLLMMVSRRRRLLDYLRRHNQEAI